MTREIVVSGGAGFWCGDEGLALDTYVLSLTGKPRPNVCYLATAAGDSAEFIQGFYDGGVGIDEYAAVRYVDGEVHETVSSVGAATAHIVQRQTDGAVSTQALTAQRVSA